MKTCPSGHWRVCCFMRMCNTLVPKTQSITLAKRNLLLPFSYVFDIYNQYYSILPPQTQDFKAKSLKEAPEDISESVSSWRCMILLYKKNLTRMNLLTTFIICLSFVTNNNAYYLLKHKIFRQNHESRTQRTLASLLLHDDV